MDRRGELSDFDRQLQRKLYFLLVFFREISTSVSSLRSSVTVCHQTLCQLSGLHPMGGSCWGVCVCQSIVGYSRYWDTVIQTHPLQTLFRVAALQQTGLQTDCNSALLLTHVTASQALSSAAASEICPQVELCISSAASSCDTCNMMCCMYRKLSAVKQMASLRCEGRGRSDSWPLSWASFFIHIFLQEKWMVLLVCSSRFKSTAAQSHTIFEIKIKLINLTHCVEKTLLVFK